MGVDDLGPRGSRAGGRLVALGAVMALTATGCAGARDSASASVRVESFAFGPRHLAIQAGTEVTWTNGDAILHTVTTGTPGRQGVPGVSEDIPAEPDGMLDRRLDEAGSEVSFTFREPGTYRYYCSIHAGMTGTVVVR